MTSGKQRKGSAQSPAGGARHGNQQRQSNRAARMAAQKKAEQRRQLITWLGTGLVIAIVAVAAIILINNRGDDENDNTGPASVATIVAAPAIDPAIPMDGMALGNPDAPVTIIEYGDYQCPFCVRFKRNDMPTLISEYIQTGQVRFEYHEYPIIGGGDQDGESFRAAEAAVCANDQGQFWPYHNLLYANSLGEFVGSFSTDRLKRMAEQVPGLDLETFNACLDNRTHRDTVQQMANEAQAAGINSTPSFMINGRLVSGADYGAIKDVIEDEFAGQ
jgi:protein-disulfide isomerase